MQHINFLLKDDYDLKGPITNFEPYMFATKAHYIKQHEDFAKEIIVVNGKNHELFSSEKLDDRIAAMQTFNEIAKEKITHFPKSNKFSCILIYFIDTDGKYEEEDIFHAYDVLQSLLVDWSAENNRIAVMVPHMYQQDVPHAHILCERKIRKYEEFQKYIVDKMPDHVEF